MANPLFELKARFQLDGNHPASFEAEDEDGRLLPGFYVVLLVAPAAGSPRIHQVTFLLDETYEQPLRKATRPRNDFGAEITSYGDFAVVAKVEAEDDVHAAVGWLSDLLAKGHATDLTPAIRRAIDSIAAN